MKIKNNCFSVTDKKNIPSIDSVAYKISHNQTGLSILYIQNDDKNKVFYAAFRTPPKDNSGASHILEHSVLCGSKKFPAKDLFNELIKGSINTYLNAMTFSDKTMYPIASQNNKDFFNLMSVYLDSVLNPLIHETPEYFYQEGWSYGISKKSSPVEINGIVYNEMKGAYANPERILIKKIDEAIFRSTPYEYDSGGVPNSIPTLTYERLIEFYDTFYKPSNCLMYLYGDLDINAALELISEALGKRPPENAPALSLKCDFAKQDGKIETAFFSVNEEKKDGSYYAVSYPACDYIDYKTSMSLEILNYILAGNDAAPLRSAVRKSGLCGDFSSYYRASSYKTSFSFVGKNCKDGKFPEFKKLVQETLKQLETGIDKTLIKGAINKWEFFINEANFGSSPNGLYYGILAASAWAYGGDVYNAVNIKDIFEQICEEANDGLFEHMLKKYLTQSENAAYTILEPKKGLIEEEAKRLSEELANYKAGLSGDEVKQMIKKSRELDSFRKKPSSKRDINKIPSLSVRDLPREIPKLSYSTKDRDLVCEHTKEGIDYINLYFDIKGVSPRLIPYCGLLREILGKTETSSYTSQQIINELNIYAGGVKYTADALSGISGDCIPRFGIKIKALEKNTEKVLSLISEVLAPRLDVAAVKRIVDETVLKLESDFLSNGHSVAINRSLSYLFPAANYTDHMSGIAYYNEICGKTPEEITVFLNEALSAVFCRENLFMGIASGDSRVTNKTAEFSLRLRQGAGKPAEHLGINTSRNEGYIFDGGVCFNTEAYNLFDAADKYSGKLQVAKSLLNLDYLWPEIRNKSGAYGCGCGFHRYGGIYFYSYRDPELINTYDVFKNSFKILKEYKTNKKTLSKYIINAIKPYEKPLKPSEALDMAMSNHLTGITEEMRQTERDEILSASLADINSIGETLERLGGGLKCTIGSKSKIEAENIFAIAKNLRLTR